MSNFKRNSIVLSIIAVLIATASWAFYSIINEGAGDLLNKFEITNIYYQSSIVIVFVVILLFILGYSARKTLKKIISGN